MRAFSIIKRLTLGVAVSVVVWLMLVGGDLSSWVIAVPSIALASSTVLLWPAERPIRVSPLGAVHFGCVFLWRCFVAGLDVARRAFGPRSAIRPGMADYHLRLPDASSRTFLANTVSLLPGTLSTAIQGDTLRMHVLDRRSDFLGEVERFESLVAAMLRRPGVTNGQHPHEGASP